jgi:thiol-disulfide isomerase/thioredoxin
LLAFAACDNNGSAATAPSSLRSDQIIATAPTTPAPAVSVTPLHAATIPPRVRKLCDGDGNVAGRTLPKAPALHVEGPGERPLDGTLPIRHGDWTWISFWAAWCGPCKEEIPRLTAWRDRLAAAGLPMNLIFVSLDDDERQLDAFLGAQPATGLRSTLWLPDGPVRKAWAKSFRLAEELPQQALIGPTGRLRCFIEGAVEDGDYAEIAALVAR